MQNKGNVLLALLLVSSIALIAILVSSACPVDAKLHDVELRSLDHPCIRQAKGLNPLTYNYTIKNTGEASSQDVVVELLQEPPGWQHFILGSSAMTGRTYQSTNVLEFEMPRGDVVRLSLLVTPAPDQLNRTYWMPLNVYPKKDPGENESHEIGVAIPQFARFEMVLWRGPPLGEIEVIPPSEVTIVFALYNLGNGVDSFLVLGGSSREDIGWHLTWVDGLDEFGVTPDLAPDIDRSSPHLITAKVLVPEGERASTLCQVITTATSMYNTSKEMPPAMVTIRVVQYYSFQVSLDGPDERIAIPGEQVEFRLKVRNKGNGWDEFSITPIWDAELNIGFVASSNPRTVLVEPGTAEAAHYIVKVPSSAPRRTYFFTAEVTSTGLELAPVTKSFSVIVEQFYAIALEVATPQQETVPGGVLDYELVVCNRGNGLDSITLDVLDVPSGWLTYIQPPEVSLLQDQISTVQLRVIVPSRFEEAPIGSYVFEVRATSSRSEAEAVADLRIDITQFYRVEWVFQDLELTGHPPNNIAHIGDVRPRRDINPFEKASMDITLEVRNFGNGADNITLEATSTDGRVLVGVSPSHTMLLRDQVKAVKVHVEVPEVMPPGAYVIFINVSSQDTTFITKVVPLEFEVYNLDVGLPAIPTLVLMEDDGPVMNDVVRAELVVDGGEALSFKVVVENKGTKAQLPVTVRCFDTLVVEGEAVRWNFLNLTTPPIAVGDRYILGERGSNPIHWVAGLEGVHLLEFKVFAEHQANGANDVSRVSVTVREDQVVPEPPIGNHLMLGVLAAIAIGSIIALGFLHVHRRRPRFDRDLYASIYCEDLDGEGYSDYEGQGDVYGGLDER